MAYYFNYCDKIDKMTLSRITLGKIDDGHGAIEFDNFIIQESNVDAEASLTTTVAMIESVRTPPRMDASFGEILSFLNILQPFNGFQGDILSDTFCQLPRVKFNGDAQVVP